MKSHVRAFALVVLLLGCGDGGPSAAQGTVTRIRAGRGPSAVALADFNRDGRLDLVVANERSNDGTVLYGDGAGGFTSASGPPLAAGPNPSELATGDFDRDGQVDVAFANHETSLVTVLLARGGSAPASGYPFDTGSRP